MKLWLICYAHPGRYPAERIFQLQQATAESAISAGFDEAVPFRFEHLDSAFVQANSALFSHARGAGYWVWKPYLALKMLESKEVDEGDIIQYCDSKILFTKSVKSLIDVFLRDNLNVMTFRQLAASKMWTKRDCFVLTKADEPRYVETTQRVGGFWLFRKGDFARHFFKTMLAYHQDPRIISDCPNQCGLLNYPTFQEHRHCESLISILAKMFDLYPYRFPSSWFTKEEMRVCNGEFTDASHERFMETINDRNPPFYTTFRQYPDMVRDEKSTYEDITDYP